MTRTMRLTRRTAGLLQRIFDHGRCYCVVGVQKANEGVTFNDGGRVCVGIARWARIARIQKADERDWFQVEKPMLMLIDNQAAIRQLETEESMSSVKYVDVRMKFICDYARKGVVKPKFVELR